MGLVVKMTLICRDLMLGNPKLAEMGWEEESMGRNGIWEASRASACGPTGSLTATLPRPL